MWAIERQEGLGVKPGQKPAILYAYDATNISTMLYNSAQVVSRDQGGCAEKFQVPTIANGKVYVSTQNELDIFGLLGSGSAPNVYLSTPCHTFPARALNTTSPPVKITLTNSGTATLQISSIALTGTNSDRVRADQQVQIHAGRGQELHYRGHVHTLHPPDPRLDM